MSGTTQVAWPGKPVTTAEPGWPKGALELVNDPLRINGWNPWFSECPNDVNHYEFRPQDRAQLNALLEKFGSIQCSNRVLRLNPGREPHSLGFSTVLTQGNNTSVLFSIWSQTRLNQWYERLQETEPGVRSFGVHRYTGAPPATPPTLTLFAGHEVVRLKDLKVPAGVQVVADVSNEERRQLKDSKLLSDIDAFVAEHSQPKTDSPNKLQSSLK